MANNCYSRIAEKLRYIADFLDNEEIDDSAKGETMVYMLQLMCATSEVLKQLGELSDE